MNKKILIILSIIVFIAIILIILILIPKPSLSEEYIINQIDKANYCNTKDDCGQVNSKCPFSCHVFVNKNKVAKINRLINSYQSDQGFECTYACATLKDFDCINNKCQVIYE